MKKAVCILLIIGLLLTYTSCAKVTDSQETGQTANTSNTTEQVTLKEKLSKSCDFVLASGKDWDGSYYELVLVLSDSADFQIGVIKNNEWLQKPDENNPILKTEDMQSFLDKQITEKDFEEYFSFIGNGTFFVNTDFAPTKHLSSDGLFYNSSNSETVYFPIEKTEDMLTAYYFKFVYSFYDRSKYSKEHFEYVIFAKNQTLIDENVIHAGEHVDSLYILNTNTMEIKDISLKVADYYELVYPISEGLFAVENPDAETMDFYDIKGIKKFSAECKDYGGENVIFQNGQCSFVCDFKENKTITIDTNGNEIKD